MTVNGYQFAIGAMALAVVGLGGALAWAMSDDDGMHGGHGAMSNMSMMGGTEHDGMANEMRALLGDEAYNRMVEYMRSADTDGHLSMMMTHMGMDGSTTR